METGLISNIQRYSLHDGPGIRTTVFLKGCPLRCAWCHNPENISPRPQLRVIQTLCLQCGQCRTACPRGADSQACEACRQCLPACPTSARVLVGSVMTLEELMELILKDRIFFEDSQGGVTFSGGEPLFQSEFLKSLLLACRQSGLHTTVDTCGFTRWPQMAELVPWTNLFLYDLKLMDERRHQEFCGASNRPILDNLRQLSQVHDHIWIRIPLLPGLNDGPEELDAMAHLAAGLAGVRQVHLLPYHRLGQQKHPADSQAGRVSDLAPPSEETVQAAAARFAAFGLKTIIGG